MALVTCPECGKKNVSDTATACPNCGYHIADYFTQLNKAKREDERKKAEIDELTKKGVLSASTIKGIQEGRNMDKEIKRDKEIDKQKIPEDNSQSLKSNQAGFWFGGIFVGLGLLGIILAATLDELSFGMFLIYGFLIGLGLWGLGSSWSSYEKDKAEYQLYQELGEREYKKRKYEEKERAQANKDPLTTLYQQQQQQASIIWCPMCHMPSGEKISATRRVVSTTALGLASSDIGKQYRCKSCGHKW